MSRRKVANRKRLNAIVQGGARAAQDILDGPTLFITHTVAAVDLEILCRRVSRKSGQRVDFGYCGGRASIHVAASCDVERARRVLWDLMPLHDRWYRNAIVRMQGKRGMDDIEESECARQIDGIHAFNTSTTPRRDAGTPFATPSTMTTPNALQRAVAKLAVAHAAFDRATDGHPVGADAAMRQQRAVVAIDTAQAAVDAAMEDAEHDAINVTMLRAGDYVVGFARFVDRIERDGATVVVHWSGIEGEHAPWRTPAHYEVDIFRSN